MKICRKGTGSAAGENDFVQSKQKQIQSMVETQSAAVAKEKNIGIVMHKRVVPAGAVDITDEVLKKLNGVSDPSSTDKK